MRKWSVIIAALLLLASHDPASAGIKDVPFSIITPGGGIGNIRVGLPMKEVINRLEWGKPDSFEKITEGDYVMLYRARGVRFIFYQPYENTPLDQSELRFIIIYNPSFTVADIGVRVGDSEEEAIDLTSRYLADCKKRQREEKEVEIYLYECANSGISFIVNIRQRIIQAIVVFEPGRP